MLNVTNFQIMKFFLEEFRGESVFFSKNASGVHFVQKQKFLLSVLLALIPLPTLFILEVYGTSLYLKN